MVHTLADDRRFCRDILPGVSRTFAINIRLLKGGMGEAVRSAYLLCRIADALEDSWPGTPAEVGTRFDRLLAAIEGDASEASRLADEAAPVAGARSDLELVAHFPRVWRVWRALPSGDGAVIADCVRTLAGGMRRYATRAAARPEEAPYLDTEAELHDYCWVVAGCVGVMLTRLFERRSPAASPELAARRLALAPAVGEALQLTNILLDWPADVRRGRCHVPADWLAVAGLRPTDLVREERPEVRAIADQLETLARDSLARVPEYLAMIPARHMRYRLFCLLPAVWAEASLSHARRDPTFPWGPNRPRLPKRELWTSALRACVIGSGGRALQRKGTAGGHA